LPGWAAYWLFCLASMLSLADIKPADSVAEERGRLEISTSLWVGVVVHTFVGLWALAFFDGLAAVTIAITVSEWYFEIAPTAGCCHCVIALFKALLYHSGSISLGSLVLAVIQVVRFGLAFIDSTFRCLSQHVMCLRCLVRVLDCLLACGTCIVRFINYESYMMIGILGRNFCSSACSASSLIARHPARFASVKGVMWTVRTIGHLAIVGITLLFTALVINRKILPQLTHDDIRSPWPCLIVTVFFGIVISCTVSSVYTAAGSTLFYCYACDEDMGGGKGRVPPEGLAEITTRRGEHWEKRA